MPSANPDFLEIKRHKNKPDQQFGCELLHREDGYAVLRYRAKKPGQIADMHIPPGSTTIAHYWTNRSYVAWRMFDREGSLLGTLFHVCCNVNIHEQSLSYNDLLLDIWVDPEGVLRILDEDEVSQAASHGLLSDGELTIIDNAHWLISAHYSSIMDELTPFDPLHSA